MRRLVWQGGSSFELQNCEAGRPAPAAGQVVVQVKAIGICATDIHILNGALPIAKPPMVLGHEIAGEVAAVADDVERVRAGDRVTVDSVVGCNECWFCRNGSRQFCIRGYELGVTRDGGCQDYITVPQENVYRVPDAISYEEAAILDMEVWAAVGRCGMRPGDAVLVLGDGPAGMIACQVAHVLGAGFVVLGGKSRGRLACAEQWRFADRCVAVDDERAWSAEDTEKRGFDCVFDFAGNARSFSDAVAAVRPGGRLLLYGLHERPVPQFDVNQIVLKDLTVYGALSDRTGWEDVIALVGCGKLKLAPLITHRFPMDALGEAYDCVQHQRDGLVKAIMLL